MHLRRNFGLDLARAAAICMVLLAHGISATEPLGVGVDLFFLLSGFLIGRIYLRGQADAHESAGTFSPFKFWWARWFRTLPPYLAALALFAIAHPHFHNNAVHPDYLLFLQNYIGIDGFGPSWSLCIEEHFYLLLPLLGYVLLRVFGRRSLIWLLPLLALVPQIWRTLDRLYFGMPTNWFWRSHLHSEGMVLGVWLAYVFVDHPELWQRLRRPAFALAVLPFALLAYQFHQPHQPAAFETTVFLLYAIGYAGWLRLLYDLSWAPANFIGRFSKRVVQQLALASYSIYLLHVLLFTDVRVYLDSWPRGPAKTLTIFAVTLALAFVFYFVIERPTILLRDKINRGKVAPDALKPAATGQA